MTFINERPASPKPKTAQQNGVGDRALEPVIRSALGVVRESASLLHHLAGFGIAFLSDPEPKAGIKQTRAAPPKGANVILFPQLGSSSDRPKLNRNRK
jgi:hypothetical protein